MPATRHESRLRRLVVTVSLIVFVGAVAHVLIGSRPSEAAIPFPHRVHVVDAEIACADCHEAATGSTTSADNLLPSRELCLGCHEEPDIDRYGYTERAIERELIFSHALHSSTVGLDCNRCHEGIDEATTSPFRLPAMDGCVACHAERQMNDDCSVCHSQVEWRRPEDHVADWVLDHVDVARSDARSCEQCHTQTYCQECHDGAALGFAVVGDEDAPRDRIGPLAGAAGGLDPLILQRAHGLNYRFTHGSDVRAKTSDCAICHETESFCVACHDPAHDGGRFRPVWHEVADFRFAAHADIARNDIELCAGCHDQSGAESTCLTCHRNAVSPHPDGFMQDVKGSWHDDDNAVCFVCHDPSSRETGIGFCTRCHGPR